MFGKKKEKENTKELEIEAEESLPEKGEKRIYEVGYSLVPTVAEGELGERISYIKDAVEGNGGAVISEGWPKKRKLAYTISRKEEGKSTDFNDVYFGWIKFENTPDVLAGIKEKLEDNSDILRFIIVKTVREDTRREPERKQRREKRKKVSKKESAKEKISEEELDEAIDELVVE